MNPHPLATGAIGVVASGFARIEAGWDVHFARTHRLVAKTSAADLERLK